MAQRKDSKQAEADHTITEVLKVTRGTFECCIVGRSIICNRMSKKTREELLAPRGRKTTLEKALTMKHDPPAEYRASPYTLSDAREPTFIAHLASAFKRAMMTAALDLPGARKAQIGRLTYVEGDYVGIYGVPKLFMSTVRSADMNRTPDIRTRAIIPEWAARLRVTFVQPLIKAQAVANLLAAAGITAGVGDWRPEKGSGNYGTFRIVDHDDPDFRRIVATGGRAVQIAALDKLTCYDDETTELLSWYYDEVERRKKQGVDHHVDPVDRGTGSSDQVVGKRARTNHAAPSRASGSRPSESLTRSL